MPTIPFLPVSAMVIVASLSTGFAIALFSFGESKVEQFDALPGDEDIGGLEVAVRDALPVRGVEGIADLCGIFQRLVERQRAFERRSFDVLHDQVIWSDVVKLADVRMIERRNGLRLSLEALAELSSADFDRWLSRFRRGIVRFPDLPHTAFSDGLPMISYGPSLSPGESAI